MRKLILSMLALLLCIAATNAQDTETVIVAHGRTTNQFVPIYGWYVDDFLRCQTIYPEFMLTDIVETDIQGITYYLSSPAVASWGDAVFEVRVGAVSTELFTDTNWIDISSFSTVYTGQLDGTSPELTINFETPYTYTGGNLCIEVNVISEGTYKRAWFYGMASEGATIQGYNGSSWTNITATIQNFIPMTGFIVPASASCAKPTIDLVTRDETSASIAWSETGTATQWSFRLNNGAWQTITENPYTITDLSANTDYVFALRSICGTGDTSFASYGSFRTTCSIQNIPYVDNFDYTTSNTVPDCWIPVQSYTYQSYAETNIYPCISSTGNPGNSICMISGITGNTTMIATPQLSVDANTCYVSFDAKGSGSISVGVLSDPTDPTTFAWVWGEPLGDASWTTYNVNLARYTWIADNPAKYIAFRVTGNGTYQSVYIDNFAVSLPPTCDSPIETLPYSEDFETCILDDINFPLCWTDVNGNFCNVQSHVTVESNFLYIPGQAVVASPIIDFRGSDLYLRFNMQMWSPSGTMAVGIAASPLAEDVAEAVFFDTIEAENTHTYNTYEVICRNRSNLQNGCIVFKTLGGYWIDDLMVFEAPATCLHPFDLSASATDSSLTLSWAEYGNATQWLLKVGDGVWRTINSNPYTLDELEPNTEYAITLASLCNGLDTTESIFGTFRTSCSVESLPYSENFETNTIGGGTVPDCWTGVEGINYVEYGINASAGNNCLHMQGLSVVASPIVEFSGNDLYVRFDAKIDSDTSSYMAIGIAASQLSEDVDRAVYIDTIEMGTTYNTYDLIFQNNNNLQRGCIVFRQITNSDYRDCWIDELMVTERPTCLHPFDLSATATNNSLNLSWTEYGNATQWLLKVDDGVWRTINSNPYTLDELEPNTEYTITLSALCNGVDTTESIIGSFRTMCNAETLTFSESFENDIDCWRIEKIIGNAVWEFQNNNYQYPVYEGHQFISFESYDIVQTRLISPMIDCDGFNNVRVAYAHIQKALGTELQDSLRVEYRLDGNDEWHVVASYTNDIQEWTVDTIVLPESSPTLQIAFHGYTNNGWGIGIDDVKIFINEQISIACVSVDQNGHNVVKWEPMQNSTPTRYNIYRDGLGGYTQVDYVENTGTTEYSWEDMSSNTATQAYSYKISETYSNGTESDISLPHTTMHLQISQGQGSTWNLSWTPYIGFLYDGYRIYRGTSAENMEFLTELSSAATTFSDNNAPSGNIYYQVEVVASAGSGAKAIAIVSRSNTAYFDGDNGIDNVTSADDMKVYTRGKTIVIDFSGLQAADGRQSVVVYDVMGRVIKQTAGSGQQATVEIPVSSAGVYMVKVGDQPSQKVVVRP